MPISRKAAPAIVPPPPLFRELAVQLRFRRSCNLRRCNPSASLCSTVPGSSSHLCDRDFFTRIAAESLNARDSIRIIVFSYSFLVASVLLSEADSILLIVEISARLIDRLRRENLFSNLKNIIHELLQDQAKRSDDSCAIKIARIENRCANPPRWCRQACRVNIGNCLGGEG